MNIEYYLLRYVEDPMRGEGRNIAILARARGKDGDVAGFRAIGVRDGDVDLDFFGGISKTTKENAWVFEEWVEWFRAVTEEAQASPESLDAAMEELAQSAGNFAPGEKCEAMVPNGTTFDDALDGLFKRLVRVPPRRRQDRFAERVDEVIKESDLESCPEFAREAVIDFTPERSPPVSVNASFLLSSKPRAVFKVIRPQGSLQNFSRQVNDALFTFRAVIENGFAGRERCIVITGPLSDAKKERLAILGEFAHVVDVTGVNSPQMIRTLALL